MQTDNRGVIHSVFGGRGCITPTHDDMIFPFQVFDIMNKNTIIILIKYSTKTHFVDRCSTKTYFVDRCSTKTHFVDMCSTKKMFCR